MRELTRLRAACEARLAQITVPDPFTLETFCQAVAEHRDRPVRLHSIALAAPAQPFALWVGTDDADHIVVDAAATGWHRDHLACHEIGHMLFDHTTDQAVTDQAAALLLPDLDPAMIRKVLGRHAYGTQQEREAEMTATVVLERAGHRPTGRFAALDAALGRTAGW